MGTYSQDSFTDTDGTLLTAHSMDVGGGWTNVAGTFKVLNNKAVGNSNADADKIVTDVGHSDYTFQVDVTHIFTNGSNLTRPTLIFRYQDSLNFYSIDHDAGTGNFGVYNWVAGTPNLIFVSNTPIVSGVSNTAIITVNGRQLDYSYNGHTAAHMTLPAVGTTATKVGFYLVKVGAPAGQASWDNFIVTTPPTVLPVITFVPKPGNPILSVGAPGTWDESDLSNSDVFFDTIGSNGWVNQYSGFKSSTNTWATGIATAPAIDGPYTKYAGNPVLTPTGSEGTYAVNGKVIIKGATYFLFYQGQLGGIYFATSPDLHTWTRQNSGTTVIAGGFDPSGRLMADGVTFELFFAKGSLGAREIWRGTSTDGITWATAKLFNANDLSLGDYCGEPYPYGSGLHYGLFVDISIGIGTVPSTCQRRVGFVETRDGGLTWAQRRTIDPHNGGAPAAWCSQQTMDSNPVVNNGDVFFFTSGAAANGGDANFNGQLGLFTHSGASLIPTSTGGSNKNSMLYGTAINI